MSATTCVIDGFGPMPLVRPASVAELGDLIRQASADGTALYPLGGQTHIALGNSPVKPGSAIDMGGLAQIVDFPARDMTVTVQAGITMKDLREIIVRENLDLPIDVAQSHRATLGGVIAANASGPRRYGYGTMRDYVIGISAINDEGREFKAGGRVVKNVAGYDLCKLLVGSLGTLGIITQVTLKLRPRAEQQAVIGLACGAESVELLLNCIHASRTRPVCVDLLNRAAAEIVFPQANSPVPEEPWIVLVGYEGNEDAVSWQLLELVKEVGTQCRIEARIDYTALPLRAALVELAALDQHAVTLKANLLPSATAAFCLEADRAPHRPALHAHAGNGIVFGRYQPAAPAREPNLTKEQAARILTTWRTRAAQGQGSVIVPCCPSDWKSVLSVWGPPRNDAWLMREAKAKFDPKGIFNPGRFVDGI
jgi:glycolate oxidase FAD binding subunit